MRLGVMFVSTQLLYPPRNIEVATICEICHETVCRLTYYNSFIDAFRSICNLYWRFCDKYLSILYLCRKINENALTIN